MELLKKGWKVVTEKIVDVDSGQVVEACPYVLDEEGKVVGEMDEDLEAELRKRVAA